MNKLKNPLYITLKLEGKDYRWEYYPHTGKLYSKNATPDRLGAYIGQNKTMTELLFWFRDCYPRSADLSVTDERVSK